MDSLPPTSIRSLRQAGAALRARRKACNLTQNQLAKATGDIETGVVSVSLDVYLRLLEPLGGELCMTTRAAQADTPGHGT